MKRLYRSQDDRMIAGVCGGLAEYLNVDPVLIRVVAVILLLPGGLPGFVPYVIMWIVVPNNPGVTERPRTHVPNESEPKE
ncbi:MAG: PspC domain-containing protein [Candidatus Saccharimonadales bacterium]